MFDKTSFYSAKKVNMLHVIPVLSILLGNQHENGRKMLILKLVTGIIKQFRHVSPKDDNIFTIIWNDVDYSDFNYYT